MAAVTGSFTAVGVGALAINVSAGEQTFSISGTFVGTVQLERAANPSLLSWERAFGPVSAAASGTLIVDATGTYRWNCTAYTSGSIVHSITPTVALRPGANTRGARSLAYGPGALGEASHPSHADKTAFGANAGALDAGAVDGQNTWIGSGAGQKLAASGYMTAVGFQAGGDRTVDIGGTYVGWQAGFGTGAAGETGGNSTGVGSTSLQNNVGSNNTAVGSQAGRLITTGSSNTFLGSSAGKSPTTTSANNVAVGAFAMELVATPVSNNVAIGFMSLKGVAGSTFTNTTAVGPSTATGLISGDGGVYVGVLAGRNITVGANTFVGGYAGQNINSASGLGIDNVIVGRAVQNANNTSNATGLTVVGQFAGNDINGASHYNTLFGYGAGSKITTGTNNLVLGPNVGSTTLTTGINNILIGVDAFTDVGASGYSNTMMLKGAGAVAVPVLVSFGTNTAFPNTSFGGTQGSVVATHSAFAGGGQTSATLLTTSLNHITVCATALDSVKLPTSSVGMIIRVVNDTANTVQVFGSGTTTINNVATAVGVPLAAGKAANFYAVTAAKWFGGALA